MTKLVDEKLPVPVESAKPLSLVKPCRESRPTPREDEKPAGVGGRIQIMVPQ